MHIHMHIHVYNIRPTASGLLAHALVTEAAEHEDSDMQAMRCLLESLVTFGNPAPAAELSQEAHILNRRNRSLY